MMEGYNSTPLASCACLSVFAVSPGMRTAATPGRGLLARQACASQLASRLSAATPANASGAIT